MKKISILFLIACISTALFSQNNSKFENKSISVFKNGTAFFNKSAVLDLGKGSIQTSIPVSETDVLFGTLWFNAPDNVIKSITSSTSKIKYDKVAASIFDMLKINIGKMAVIKLYEIDKPFDAKIVQVEDDFIVLEGIEKWISAKVSNIQYVEFKDKPVSIVKQEKDSLTYKIEVQSKNANQQIDLFYMQKGLTWTPNYYIKLLDDKKAKLTLQALLVNDNEDIENVKVNFVVGVPTFTYSHVSSPFISKQNINEFISSFGRSSTSNYSYNLSNSNVMTQQTQMRYNDDNEGDLNQIGGEATDEGLYFYKQENLTLKKGGRGFYDIAEADVEYEQIYSVDLANNQINSWNKRNTGDINQNSVWQSIRFKNTLNMPLTTGTVFVIKKTENEYKPISQNILYYSPAGINVTVKTTISPDISVIDDEFEIDRKENILKNYDLVTLQGSISITNYKDKEISLSVRRTITGELIKTDSPWKTTTKLKTYDIKNKENETCWDLKIKAGETKKVIYSYQIYVQR